MCWLRDARVECSDESDGTFTASVMLARSDSLEALQPRIRAVQAPLTPEVVGGLFRCYTEEDGTYEIGQVDPTAVQITFPADPLHARYAFVFSAAKPTRATAERSSRR